MANLAKQDLRSSPKVSETSLGCLTSRPLDCVCVPSLLSEAVVARAERDWIHVSVYVVFDIDYHHSVYLARLWSLR